MASTWMRSECARTTGRANKRSQYITQYPSNNHSSEIRRTDSHNHEETGEKAPQIQHGGAGALNEVIGIGATAADPVGYRGDDVGRNNEQRVVDLPQRAGEDHEEEAYGEDEGEGDDGFKAGGGHDGLRVVGVVTK